MTVPSMSREQYRSLTETAARLRIALSYDGVFIGDDDWEYFAAFARSHAQPLDIIAHTGNLGKIPQHEMNMPLSNAVIEQRIDAIAVTCFWEDLMDWEDALQDQIRQAKEGE